MSDPLGDWIEAALGVRARDLALYRTALTHPSHTGESYQRLEFLGDRVLGLVMADWLFALFPDEAEGKLAHRLAALVSGETCAEIAGAIGLAPHLRLGKQARDDGAAGSAYVLGDAVEALIGARFLEAGLDGARDAIRRLWGDRVRHQIRAPKHPKAELQELAAQRQWRPPVYAVAHRAGPHHAPTFTISVEIPGRASAQATGPSKQEAEKAAASVLLEQLR